jgi:hypothetical protein
MTGYSLNQTRRFVSKLGAIVSYRGRPPKENGHYLTFCRICGTWICFNDIRICPVSEIEAIEMNFPDALNSTRLRPQAS